jgi:hypothetical protein
MDQYTAERRFARCSQLWDAATSRRRYRTHQQDHTARRDQRKATALHTIAETLLGTATLAAGITGYELLANIPGVLAATGAIITAFAANNFLAPMIGAVFNPAIDRLRSPQPEGADQ